MQSVSFEECKKIEFDILSFFADYCEKKGIEYFLAYGTLLGAVRHKGFIPWDDDVDCQMTRENANKLIENFNKDNENNKYRLVSPFDKNSRHSIIKIIDTTTLKKEDGVKESNLGVDIDVFILDGVPGDDKTFNKWYNKLIKTYEEHLALCSVYSGSFKAKVKLFLQRIKIFIKYFSLDKKKPLVKAEKLHKKYPYDKCDYVGIVESCFDERSKTRKSSFEKYITLMFEGKEFRAPIDYGGVLSGIYGDYMKLPPIEQQKPHHVNNVYRKD